MNARTRIARLLALITSAALAASLAGCSSSVSPSAATNIAGATVSVPVLITDAPSDQLISFSLTINSIVLTDSAGKTASVLATPTTIEICHLNGIQAPLVTASIPQDTYVSATIAYSDPQIAYVSSSATPVAVTPTLANTSFTFNFPAPFTVSNAGTSLLFDLIASQSVTISGTTVTVSPVFTVKPVPPTTTLPPQGQNGTGMEARGAVVSAGGTTLVLQPPSGPNVTFTTGSSTTYQNVSGLSALTAGELVDVDFTVQAGACTSQTVPPTPCPPYLLASTVQLEPTPSATAVNLLSGPVLSVSSGSFKMAVMQGLGPGYTPAASAAASVFTITVNSSTVFAAAPQFVSITNLPFTPTFTAANLSPGQTVGVVASSISGNTAAAADVLLMPQTLDGTVTAIATVNGWTAYTLTLPSGSAFATLSGASTITVYTNSATVVPPSATGAAPLPPIAVNAILRFNGLVFSLGGGKFAMVAACSPDGAPGI